MKIVNDTMLNSNQTVGYFALSINGQIVSARFSERIAAEMARSSLPEEQQKLAEVVIVDSSNRQLLLG